MRIHNVCFHAIHVANGIKLSGIVSVGGYETANAELACRSMQIRVLFLKTGTSDMLL